MGNCEEGGGTMAALSILAILTAYATAGPVPTGNNEPNVQTKPFRQTGPSVTCRTEYVLLWNTEYQEKEEEVCNTVIRKKCETRTESFASRAPDRSVTLSRNAN